MSIIIEQLERMTEALTVPQVAKLLQMCPKTVYENVSRGIVPGFAVGRAVRIDPRQLADYLRGKTRLGTKLKSRA